jgi:Flp pilus assembly protein TadD
MWRLMVISRQSVALLLVLVAALPQAALALPPGQVYEQVKDSVVVVKAYDRQGNPVSQGSGVVLPGGDIITNFHVIKGGVRYTVGRGKQAAPATLKGGDPDKDLFLLTAPGLVAEPARLGKANKLKVGDPVYAVGAPQGLELSLSEGIVSQLRGGDPPIIQTTVAISPGSSGGGLFNAKGELVGITTFRMKGEQSLNFAVPVEWITEVAGRKIRERPRGEAPVAPAPGARPQEGWLDRAVALEKAGDWPGLLAHNRRWIQAEPGSDLAWFGLGNAYENLGRYREASEAFREAVRLKPDEVGNWYNLGHIYGELGCHHEAIEAYRSALRLKPDFGKAWSGLAAAYANSGNRSAALEAVKEFRRLDPQKAESLYNQITRP